MRADKEVNTGRTPGGHGSPTTPRRGARNVVRTGPPPGKEVIDVDADSEVEETTVPKFGELCTAKSWSLYLIFALSAAALAS